MKKLYAFIAPVLAIAAISCLSSCILDCVHGSGNQVSQTRNITSFNRIEISGGYKLILKQDSSLSLKITADDNLLKYIKTVNDGDRLKIYNRRNFCNSGAVVVYLGIRELRQLKASGAVETTSDGAIHTGDLDLDLSGATKTTLELNAAHVSIDGSGATEVNLKGQATTNDIDLSGVGNVHAFDFVVGTCNVETSGMGHCDVNALNALHVHSSGVSDVRYKGNPGDVTDDKSGAGSVKKVD